MRVLILTFGTRGDVQPYAALASGLRAGGHEVVLGTADGFRELLGGVDVSFLPVGSERLGLVPLVRSNFRTVIGQVCRNCTGPRDVRAIQQVGLSTGSPWDAH